MLGLARPCEILTRSGVRAAQCSVADEKITSVSPDRPCTAQHCLAPKFLACVASIAFDSVWQLDLNHDTAITQAQTSVCPIRSVDRLTNGGEPKCHWHFPSQQSQ
ncbi:hypothetical protein PoB_006544900 [Plakobranchus ocellatus]|uniref:Uncharacterized protein n=1 Tax=Plakobranchus ocellatus TaxID=259542 RepID=A0AAV4D467_9GAST|nr:hypothetical protein PoB_006544900 [Plakobranchus ocellatus]